MGKHVNNKTLSMPVGVVIINVDQSCHNHITYPYDNHDACLHFKLHSMEEGSLPYTDLLSWIISGQVLDAGVQVLGARTCCFYNQMCLSLVTLLVLYENGRSLCVLGFILLRL